MSIEDNLTKILIASWYQNADGTLDLFTKNSYDGSLNFHESVPYREVRMEKYLRDATKRITLGKTHNTRDMVELIKFLLKSERIVFVEYKGVVLPIGCLVAANSTPEDLVRSDPNLSITVEYEAQYYIMFPYSGSTVKIGNSYYDMRTMCIVAKKKEIEYGL